MGVTHLNVKNPAQIRELAYAQDERIRGKRIRICLFSTVLCLCTLWVWVLFICFHPIFHL